MSAETKTALDEAIQAHVADEMDGTLVTNYVLQTRGTAMSGDHEGSQSYFRALSDRQPLDTTLGLLRYATIYLENYIVSPESDA